jgi:hypothetical protein
MNPADKNGMAGVAVQPQAIRTFMIRYGDAARKAQPAPIVRKDHAIIEVAAAKAKPAGQPIIVPTKECAEGKPAVKPAQVHENIGKEVKE